MATRAYVHIVSTYLELMLCAKIPVNVDLIYVNLFFLIKHYPCAAGFERPDSNITKCQTQRNFL